ncbi:(2,3-dihydroxybenzoyl)adenylate synthase [Oceanobacter mangrovi]|uniref:(2,3-dihydroxybenzoyl)adenylate synthase n=1 Tax=Oceanobacter mangrovi TaxID=2862510 RepID=UPI001C8DD17A|nr:(2,3-dihydroxybenzoyl)adenylate synthase [Oceanobacter mangrovi]
MSSQATSTVNSAELVEFSRWPQALADFYRQQGYWTDRPMTDLLSLPCQRRPDTLALISEHGSLSYLELEQRSSQLAAALQRRGLHQGQTAVVQLANQLEYFVVFFALLKLGITPVNALFSHQRRELTSYAEQLQPALIIGSAEHALFADKGFIDELRLSLKQLQLVLVDGGVGYAGAESLQQLIHEAAEDFQPTPTPADEVAFFQLSGGSTGTPKLIPRTHNDYYYSIRRSVEICQLDHNTRFLCALPIAHNYTMSSPGSLGVFYAGGTVVLAPGPEAINCFRLIEKYQVSMVALVPSAVALWLQAVPGHQQQLASLQLLQVGGASFAEALARRVPAELGCQLQQVFGMAEGLVNYTRLNDDDQHRYTTQGYPMCPDDEVQVVDPESRLPVANGQPGLLLVRGPYTFRGYYRAPQHNAEVFNEDGFYASGDLVVRDDAGYLQVVGRIKDQINRGGEKVAAEEIENLLLHHPDIYQAALISVPDQLMGEKSLACIVSHSGKLRAIDVRKYLRAEGIAEYKLPDKVQLLARLPLTPVGKTSKTLLRQWAEAGFPAGCDEVHATELSLTEASTTEQPAG